MFPVSPHWMSTMLFKCVPGTGPAVRSFPGSVFITLLLMLYCVTGSYGSVLNCHSTCICASNIISCSKKALITVPTGLPHYTVLLDLSHNNLSRLRADWTQVRLNKLLTLLLSHNGIIFVSAEAFSQVPNLQHLDLSSNKLKNLEEGLFSELKKLEVLLLYNNHISQIEKEAFGGLLKLQKLYLSQNQISRFPMELLKEKSGLPELRLLDMSSNKLKVLPLNEVSLLPSWIKNNIYLHNNPFTCDCALYDLFVHWFVREFDSVVEFKDELKCSLVSHNRIIVGILSIGESLMNCSSVKESDLETYLGETLTINCDTRQRDTVKAWLSPQDELISSEETNQSTVVLKNGSLQIRNVATGDSGSYKCLAISSSFNETLYVNVKVYNFTKHGPHETLNTAYTTLVGCVASVILVLIYLYLTPCRCCCKARQKSQHDDSIHSSMLSATPSHELPTGKGSVNRHVAFIETSSVTGKDQNGKLKPSSQDEQKGKSVSKKSDTDSISSVFLDNPTVV
ncbi:amphoterin-induced protein 1 [Protopterus annectens]|uniref:amphoterin-induced protein 1 n=1 Tax=Protopterus annectens TaxID=7888 RepID=UPI001CFB6F77|nr:amphoterin-induced protein 1 [Protopterus annectens]